MVSIHAAYQLLAQNKKVAPWPPSTACRPLTTAPGLSPAIEAAMGAAWETGKKDTTMATIGTFLELQRLFRLDSHLALNAKAKLVRVENPSKGRTSASSGLMSS
ncbi:hypothetical protein LMTR3_21765 [Bradyrhizobium sp. LMTR 3]|nr:hypothetical protein LMTR3_21765 [Bradyrhizobium sp. LMTR 3]